MKLVINNIEFNVDVDVIAVGAYSYGVEPYTAALVAVEAEWKQEEVVEVVMVGTHPTKGQWDYIPSVDGDNISRVWEPARLRIPVRVRRWVNQFGGTVSPLDICDKQELRQLYLSGGEVELNMTDLIVENLPATAGQYVYDDEAALVYYQTLIEEEVLPDYLSWVEERARKEQAAAQKQRAEEVYLASDEHQAKMKEYQPIINFLNKKSFPGYKGGADLVRSILKPDARAEVIYRWGDYHLAIDGVVKGSMSGLTKLLGQLGYRPSGGKPVLRKK